MEIKHQYGKGCLNGNQIWNDNIETFYEIDYFVTIDRLAIIPKGEGKAEIIMASNPNSTQYILKERSLK